MRGKVGDVVTLFDGSGRSWQGNVEAISSNTVKNAAKASAAKTSTAKTTVSVRIFETLEDAVESPLRLTVASALPKGDRQRFLIEKLAELGVARFVPLRLERSVARADEKTTVKFRRYVVEAAKQCGRNVLMEITEEKTLAELSVLLDSEFLKLILHPASLGAENPARQRDFLSVGVPTKTAMLVGPEGSFTDGEIGIALSFGFIPLDLGARILRTETACVAAASAFLTF